MKSDRQALSSRTISFEEHLAEELNSDPEFRAHWERTAFARALAIEVIGARLRLRFSQEDLAKHLDVPLAVVESLEDGEDDPSLDTIQLLADRLGLRFTVTVTLESPQSVDSAPPALHTRLEKSAA